MSAKLYLGVLMAITTGIRELHAAASSCTVSCESYTLNEAINLIRGGAQNGTIRIGSDQVQINGSSCVSRKDLEDLKRALMSSQRNCTGVTVSDSGAFSALRADVSIIKADVRNVRNRLESNVPQTTPSPSCASRRDVEDLRAVCTRCASNQLQCTPSQHSNASVELRSASTLLAKCLPVLIQQNFNGSHTFNRSWADYKVGFNDSRGNFWIGNDLLHQLTLSGRYKVRFELKSSSRSSWYWAEYTMFIILSETHNYRLLLSGYTGDIGDYLSNQDKMMFGTYDRDNDPWRNGRYNDNCAVWRGGGFWYKDCGLVTLNTVGGRDHFKWRSTSLLTSRMWLTC